MENGIGIRVLYYAEQTGIMRLNDLDGIAEFRRELSAEYVSVVQGKPGPLGGLEKFLIDIIADISLETFVKFILGGLAYDLIQSGTKKYLLRPLIEAYKKLKSKNPEYLDIERFTIIFEDTTIHIYQLYDNSIIEQLDGILNNVAIHYPSLITAEGERPSEIHIAVFPDNSNDRLAPYRVKLDVDETIPYFSEKDYLTYWGVFYEYSNQWIVYDLDSKRLLGEHFLTLEQYWDAWKANRR